MRDYYYNLFRGFMPDCESPVNGERLCEVAVGRCAMASNVGLLCKPCPVRGLIAKSFPKTEERKDKLRPPYSDP